MKLFQQIKYWSLFVLVAFSLNACEKNDDYGDGSPQASNIVPLKYYSHYQSGTKDRVYQCEYNSDGLITVINLIQAQTDEEGNTSNELRTVARISYPQSNRAVMETTEYEYGETYVFAFGSNNFAHRIIETDHEEGESYLIKLSYDNEGHITKMDDAGDVLKMEFKNGNLTKAINEENGCTVEITYGTDTDLDFYNISPFLLNVDFDNFGYLPFDSDLEYALHAGFLGRPFATNLPATFTVHDDMGQTISYDFEYYIVMGEGRYRLTQRYDD